MLKQHLQLKLQQKLSPQQIQLMKLLQVTTMDLEQRIKEELMDNPALEEGSDESEADSDSELMDKTRHPPMKMILTSATTLTMTKHLITRPK